MEDMKSFRNKQGGRKGGRHQGGRQGSRFSERKRRNGNDEESSGGKRTKVDE